MERGIDRIIPIGDQLSFAVTILILVKHFLKQLIYFLLQLMKTIPLILKVQSGFGAICVHLVNVKLDHSMHFFLVLLLLFILDDCSDAHKEIKSKERKNEL